MNRSSLSPQVEVLDCFAGSPNALSAAEIIRMSGLPRSTVFRALRVLTDAGFLARATGHARYILGARMLRLGMIARTQLSADDSLAAPLHRLARRTGETITFSVIEMRRRVCTYVVESARDLRYEAHVGERYPIHVGAAGKVILAYLPHDSILDLVEAEDLSRWRIRELLADLADIRATGYAITEGERVEGVIAIAAPVFAGDAIMGSVAIVGPSSRSGSAMAAHAPPLLEIAQELTKRFTTHPFDDTGSRPGGAQAHDSPVGKGPSRRAAGAWS